MPYRTHFFLQHVTRMYPTGLVQQNAFIAHTTEYTELQPLVSGVHSVMRVKLALASEGGGCTPTPSYYIYHHQ